MTLENLVNILTLREKYIITYIDLYSGTFNNNEELQNAIDDYATGWAKGFLKEYGQHLENDPQLQLQLRQYLWSVGADKKHSGKRVCEALYKQLNTPQDSTDDTEPNR